MTERAILWVLLNTDLKLSYDDISAVLGKERSTISRKLNSKKHGAWWRAFKKRRSKERKRLCQERWRKGFEARRLAERSSR